MREHPPSTDVTVIGLGNMGSALARAFLVRGHSVTVWNRSHDRAAPLVKEGARVAETAATAVAASPLTVMCVIDYPAAESILGSEGMAAALSGRTLVQLSTGTDDEARVYAKLVDSRGGHYLDGGIMCFPRDIGKPATAIVFSGAPGVYAAHEQLLSCLAGAARHVGEDPGTAMVIYLALWTFYLGAQGAFLEGAALSAAAGMPLNVFADLTVPMMAKLEAGNRFAAHRLDSNNLAGDEASIDAFVASHGTLVSAFNKANVKCDILNAYFSYLARAQQMGFGALDAACAFDVLAPGLRRK